jgi:hypothetical protein
MNFRAVFNAATVAAEDLHGSRVGWRSIRRPVLIPKRSVSFFSASSNSIAGAALYSVSANSLSSTAG